MVEFDFLACERLCLRYNNPKEGLEMKKIVLLIMIVLMLPGMSGCFQDATPYAAESLYTEPTLAPIEDNNPAASDEIKEEEIEDSQETLSEPAVFDIHENYPESTAAETVSNPIKPPASSASLPATTGTPSEPATAPSSSPTEPTAPVYTQKDFDEIISVIREYAENEITTVQFIWDPMIKMEVGHGWHDTPNLNKRGKDGVIRTLKYNVDLTVDVVSNPVYNVNSVIIPYNIIWYEKENEYSFEESGSSIYFVLLY